ncbi:hypothetical protein BC830DRAFT_1118901 [Chytriomyces sp. MP71]|nr:hypothetical protein BC830DRAFT_1118901 [Chytriomyces sp. MP71]
MLGPIATRIGLGFAANAGLNTMVGAYSVMHKTEKWFDFCGSLAFLASALVPLAATTGLQSERFHPLHVALGGTTCVWAARLLYHLTSRIHRLGEDKRFDAIKRNRFRFSVSWFIQTLWVGFVSYPTVRIVSTPAEDLAPLGTLAFVGLGIWVLGFGVEVVADKQKSDWQTRMGKERRGKFINEGLWSLCRYPNYFGELTLWAGSYLMAVSAFPDSLATVIGFSVSPAFISLLLFKLSGIPPQERLAAERFKGNAAYAEYVRKTSPLIPWFPRT